MKPPILVTLGALGTLLTSCAAAQVPSRTEAAPPPSSLPPLPEIVEPTWQCNDCSPAEQRTLEFLQERGIKDRAALATVMGNIRQESNFIANVCEGGARVKYEDCRKGGYGIIQFTSLNRYKGLGLFAKKYGLDPSSLEGQLRYMVNEPHWKKYELTLKAEGQSIERYMYHAYFWLGWGIKGARSLYAYDYYNKFVFE